MGAGARPETDIQGSRSRDAPPQRRLDANPAAPEQARARPPAAGTRPRVPARACRRDSAGRMPASRRCRRSRSSHPPDRDREWREGPPTRAHDRGERASTARAPSREIQARRASAGVGCLRRNRSETGSSPWRRAMPAGHVRRKAPLRRYRERPNRTRGPCQILPFGYSNLTDPIQSGEEMQPRHVQLVESASRGSGECDVPVRVLERGHLARRVECILGCQRAERALTSAGAGNSCRAHPISR